MIVKTVGRGQDNNIVVNDPKVSRVHLQMVQNDSGNISVVDLNSANGTYVNGVRIVSETILKAGDEVRLGDTQLQWQNYFPKEALNNAGISNSGGSISPASKPRNKKRWIFFAAGGLILLILGCGCLVLVNRQKEKKQNDENRQMLEMENKLKEAEREVAKLDAEYTIALEKAKTAKTKHERDSLDAIVVEKAEQAKKAKNNITTLTKDKEKLEKSLKETQTKLSQKEKELNAANDKNKKLAEEVENVKNQAAAEKNKADTEKRQAELTNEFYSELNKARKANHLKSVCKVMGLPAKDKEDVQYDAIVNMFNKESGIEKRTDIVNKIKAVNTETDVKPKTEDVQKQDTSQKNDQVSETPKNNNKGGKKSTSKKNTKKGK